VDPADAVAQILSIVAEVRVRWNLPPLWNLPYLVNELELKEGIKIALWRDVFSFVHSHIDVMLS
jgi:hypothetical protein